MTACPVVFYLVYRPNSYLSKGSVDPDVQARQTKEKTPWLNWIEQPPPKGQVARLAICAGLIQTFIKFVDECTNSKKYPGG